MILELEDSAKCSTTIKILKVDRMESSFYDKTK